MQEPKISDNFWTLLTVFAFVGIATTFIGFCLLTAKAIEWLITHVRIEYIP